MHDWHIVVGETCNWLCVAAALWSQEAAHSFLENKERSQSTQLFVQAIRIQVDLHCLSAMEFQLRIPLNNLFDALLSK